MERAWEVLGSFSVLFLRVGCIHMAWRMQRCKKASKD
jgi:hypothetical protein